MASLVKYSKYWQKTHNLQGEEERGRGRGAGAPANWGQRGRLNLIKAIYEELEWTSDSMGKAECFFKKQATDVHPPFPSPLFPTELEARARAMQQEK